MHRLLVPALAMVLAACDLGPESSRDTSQPPAGSGETPPSPTDGGPTASRPANEDNDRPPLRRVDATQTQCVQGENHLYSCPMADGQVVSVCVGDRQVSYRFGPLGEPEMDLTVPQGRAGVWQGLVVGQGGGSQTHIRFARGGYDYVVFSGVDGRLADNPGRTYSGVAVLRGGDDISRLDCPVLSTQTEIPASMIPDYVPPETQGGPYDAWF